jgi:hypothetical protein
MLGIKLLFIFFKAFCSISSMETGVTREKLPCLEWTTSAYLYQSYSDQSSAPTNMPQLLSVEQQIFPALTLGDTASTKDIN